MNIRNTALVVTAIIINRLNNQSYEQRGGLVRDVFEEECGDRRIKAILRLLALFDSDACDAFQQLVKECNMRIDIQHKSFNELSHQEIVATAIVLSDHIRQRGHAQYSGTKLALPSLPVSETIFLQLDIAH